LILVVLRRKEDISLAVGKKQELHEEDTLNVSLLAWQQRCQQQRKGRLFAVKEVKHKALVVNLLMYVLLLKENVEKAAEEKAGK
jgi:hypothetical protein